MANTPTETSPASSHSQSGSRNPRVARRTNGSPRANPYPTHDTHTNRARRLVDARRWNWLPDKLSTWRNEEGIKLPNETGESSNMEISPYTQEPVHFTVPVLAVRLNRHEQQIRDMDLELQETREHWRLTALERINQVSEDHENTVQDMDILHNQLEETTETMEIVHNQVINNRNEISVLQSRLQQCETRLRETEDTLRMVSRLAESVDHLAALLPQLNLRRD